jgi:hypothetical protein
MKRRIDPFKLVAELLGLASVALVGCGIHAIYPPAAWIFLGVACGIPYIVSTLRSLPRQGDKR